MSITNITISEPIRNTSSGFHIRVGYEGGFVRFDLDTPISEIYLKLKDLA